ncbi:MAG: hypothetical protein IKP66_09840 [Lachnospiraceae bacterium]|nr:hypothetical protein [Lachnospiraceae bacterium]
MAAFNGATFGASKNYTDEHGGGGGGAVIDNKTIIKNSSNELQANAIIDLGNNDFPTNNILTKTYYKKKQTVNYVVEEVSKSFTMTKMFLYENGNWVSHSEITLTEEEYDHLSNSMKIDNTTYIVNGAGSLVTQWVYGTLEGKPSLNGIIINGSLTLEDINVYSRDEILQLLEGKSGTDYVDYLPATMVKLTWYFSKHYEDRTLVPDDKRAWYVLDKNNVLQFMGIVGESDLSIYQLKNDNNLQTTNKTIVGGINEILLKGLYSGTSGVASNNAVFDFTNTNLTASNSRIIEKRIFQGSMSDPLSSATFNGEITTQQYMVLSGGACTIYIDQEFLQLSSARKDFITRFYRRGYVALDSLEQYTNWVASKASSITWLPWIPIDYPATVIPNASVVDNGQIRYCISGGNLTVNIINVRSSTTASILTIGTLPSGLPIKRYGSEGYWAQLINWTDKGVFLMNINNANDLRVYQYATANKEIYGTFVLPLGY